MLGIRSKRVVVAALSIAGASLAASRAGATVLFADQFSYLDGSLTTGSGGVWGTHSGTAGQVDVASGKVNQTEAESEDVNASLGTTVTSGLLYAGVDFNFSALPSGTGTYFTHFKDSTTSGFRGRVFATTTGAAAGSYRIGIANTTAVPVVIPVDLTLGTTHRLVDVVDTATGIATLYLDSDTETGGTVATDAATALGISTYAFRQSLSSGNGMGTLTVDRLTVASTYVEAASGAVPEPSMLGLAGIAMFLGARRRRG
jgi:hypothetical protein